MFSILSFKNELIIKSRKISIDHDTEILPKRKYFRYSYLDIVREQPEEDCLGSVCHVTLSSERCLLEEPGQSSRVVQVEVRDEEQVNLISLDTVNEW